MSRTDVVLVKSFGDLVIPATVIGHIPDRGRENYRLLVGEHLVALLDAIGKPAETFVLHHGEDRVPALYDIRRCGPTAALRSAWQLRSAIAEAEPSSLLFDRIGARERWLARGVQACGLPEAQNIYLAYEATFGVVDGPRLATYAGGDIGIFPGSRVATKNLPYDIVRTALASILQSGVGARLVLLEGERPDLEASGLPHEIVPRSLGAMVAAVDRCGAIVSADSMPAHVAENRGIPVHVFSPVDNRYWLPRSAFVLDRWSLFDADIAAAMTQYLVHLTKGHE